MSQSNAIFADSYLYAKAYAGWMDLDVELWEFNAYGDHLKDNYDRVILIRPLEGVTREHILWVTTCLAPRVDDVSRITPIHWTHQEIFQVVQV